MIRPILEYGYIVWWDKGTTKRNNCKDIKIQRLGCIFLTRVMKSTPTIAMEA